MTQNETERKRMAAEAVLESVWSLFDEVGSYLSPSGTVKGDRPDFAARAVELIPEPREQSDRALQRASLAQVESMVAECTLCQLASGRTKSVCGEGAMNARLMVIGEGPGAEEDRTGRPFVGKAGQYLDSWLSAIGLDRTLNTYIANIVKCRPPENRDPYPEEAQACIPYLKRQIALVKPDAILCVGKVAAHFLLGRDDTLHAMRSTVHRFEGIPTIITYHPAAVLRNLELRAPVWEDLKRVASLLSLPVAKGRG